MRGVTVKIEVLLKPASKQEKVEQNPDGIYHVWVKAPPVEGRANKALIEVLADYFHVPKSYVRLKKGLASRKKIVEIL